MTNLSTEAINDRSRHIDTCSTQEILEIINSEDQTVPAIVRNAIPQITLAVEHAVQSLGGQGRLIYIGAGTSGRIGVIDAVECMPTYGVPPERIPAIIAGGPAAMCRAQEQIEDQEDSGRQEIVKLNVSSEDTIIGLSASGNTPFVRAALQEARKRAATTVGIICNDSGTVLDFADVPICLPTGPEVICGSTRMKAATAQKLTVNMISTATMVRLGKVIGNFMVEIEPKNEKLKSRACAILNHLCDIAPEEGRKLLEQNDWNLRRTIRQQMM